MSAKYISLPKDIQWHFIGHLQTNKIKYIIPYVTLIHGVDSYRLLSEINKYAVKADRVVKCLLQIHIAQEETKFGFNYDECQTMLSQGTWKELSNVQICGLMSMASNIDNVDQIKKEFSQLHDFFLKVKQEYFSDFEYFTELSIGMSDDYKLAIEEGSTLVRIGSRIFGERYY